MVLNNLTISNINFSENNIAGYLCASGLSAFNAVNVGSYDATNSETGCSFRNVTISNNNINFIAP